MSLKFNINRPKISDEEIKKQQNFNDLVERFKQQSLKQARGDESWWKNKKIRYSTTIAGITIVCTITYLSLFNSQNKQIKKDETLITKNTGTGAPKETTRKAFINEPSQKLKIPYSVYKINNEQGGNITHHTSSKIKIPKNSFVDKNGKDIIGDVTIEYKEFHDMGDIVVSGIPMTYDSAGTTYNFESAGMFNIKGSQNGEPVFIKPDKVLDVELASSTKDDLFNQYYLDTLKKNWQCLKRDRALMPAKTNSKAVVIAHPQITDPKLEILKREIEHIIPKKIDSVKVVYATKAERLPKAKEPVKPVKLTPGKATFKLEGSNNDFPELAAFDNVIFEVGPENRNYSKELHDITWSDIKISQGPVKGKNYLLNLSYRNRFEKLIVYPVLSGDDYEKAEKIYEQKLENYQDLVTKRTADEKRLMAEMQAKQAAYLAEQKKKQEDYDKEKEKLLAKYNAVEQNELSSNFNSMSLQTKATRLFSISQFGIFNSDCPHVQPREASIIPTFATHDKEKIISPDYIYLVDHTSKVVYSLDKLNGFKISYDPKNTYSICIFNKNKMYLCNKMVFKQTTEMESQKFIVKPLPDSADNLADFKKAIEI
jgi:hypothetical protein